VNAPFVAALLALFPLTISASATATSIEGAASSASQAERSAPGPGDVDPLLYEAVLPEAREEIIARTAGWLSRYRIDAVLEQTAEGESGRLTGSLDLSFVNDSPEPMGEIYFRLYANDASYDPGEMTVGDVTIGGATARTNESLHETLLRVKAPAPIAPGSAVDLHLTFSTTIPVRPRLSYGIMAVQPDAGTSALAHWFPLLAGRDADGWNLAPISRNGDPVFASTALFDVSLTAPADSVVVTSGIAIAEEPLGEMTRRRFVTGPVREFTVVADDDFAAVNRDVGGTLVTSYFEPEQAAKGAEVLEYAVKALTLFSDRFGRYPFREMDLAQVELQGAGGVEFPQLMYMGDDLYRATSSRNPRYLEFVTAHEVAHQWWYGLVGSNQYRHAFIDEGMAEYCSSEIYFGLVDSPEIGRRQLDMEVKLWYLTSLFTNGDAVVDQPSDDFPSTSRYGATVYAKGALGFAAIRAEIGDDAFFAALRTYAERHRFGIATPNDLRSAFEEAAGRSLDETWRHWFDAAEGKDDYTPADLEQLRADLGLQPAA
jgi:hypothetical protein